MWRTRNRHGREDDRLKAKDNAKGRGVRFGANTVEPVHHFGAFIA